MRTHFYAIVLALAVASTGLLGGCTAMQAMFKPVDANIPVAQDLPEPAKVAQNGLNEARLALAAMTDDIVSKLNRGVITAAQAEDKLGTVKRHRDKVVDWQRDLDRAVAAMNLGDIRNVDTQVAALELVLEVLEKELAQLEPAKGR